MDGVMIEVKMRLHAVRNIRDSLLQLAYVLAEQPNKRAFLLLVNPRVTELRLRDEWEKIRMTFQPDIVRRLSIVVSRGDHFIGIPQEPAPEYIDFLKQANKGELFHAGTRLPAPDYSAEILKILVYQWLMKRGSMTSVWLSETTGCNYRTVAKTLKGLGRTVLWHSDKSVELRYFPKDAWVRMLAMLDKSRATIRYADRSGQPRSLESLLRRLNKLKMPEIAVGGVLGARHYYPKLDLVGTPRLDLSFHCLGKSADLDFIENLDPALKQENDPEVSANLVLHFIRREKPFFEKGSEGVAWADPVECLLDFQEMRLEPQALEFLTALESKDEVS
jgi:hypothetical protein